MTFRERENRHVARWDLITMAVVLVGVVVLIVKSF